MNSNFERAKGFAKVSDYPRGLMNECVCGQVVLAPRTVHESCEWCEDHNDYRSKCDANHTENVRIVRV